MSRFPIPWDSYSRHPPGSKDGDGSLHPTSVTRFGEISGQVYTEHAVPSRRQRSSVDTAKLRSFVQSRFRRGRRPDGAPGAPALYDGAMRTFLLNCRDVTLETLQEVPWEIGKRLWEAIENCVLDCPNIAAHGVNLWSLFLAAYPSDLPTRHLRKALNFPQHPLSQCLAHLSPLASLLAPKQATTQFFTHLTISSYDSPAREEIMALSTLPNLAALDIGAENITGYTNRSMLDDYVLLNWARRASGAVLPAGRGAVEPAFLRLAVLLVRNQPGVTHDCLRHLSAFPALTLFGVAGCTVSYAGPGFAEAHGWTCAPDEGLLRLCALGLRGEEEEADERRRKNRRREKRHKWHIDAHDVMLAEITRDGAAPGTDPMLTPTRRQPRTESALDRSWDELLRAYHSHAVAVALSLGLPAGDHILHPTRRDGEEPPPVPPEPGLLSLRYGSASPAGLSAEAMTVFRRTRGVPPDAGPAARRLTETPVGVGGGAAARRRKLRDGRFRVLNAEGDLVEP